MIIHTFINIVPGRAICLHFGGMYQYTPMQTIIKAVLNVGTIFVIPDVAEWLKRDDTAIKEVNSIVLTLSTLLGMYFMISAGHFLMFFLGLEMASIPMAALAAFNKYRYESPRPVLNMY
jgi:NADH-quinone oxidoreductase subunit N